MPWLRSGDNAATHPIVMRVRSFVRDLKTRVLERDVAVNEVFGFVTRCALQSAGHTTDYVIDEGTAEMVGGVRTDRLLELAMKAGYLTRQKARGITTYVLVDEPEFLHMRKKAEIDRERQRKADNSNSGITVPVRLRDGDECRYCGHVVNWRDRKGGRGGTYDHRDGLGVTATVANIVVACNACNAGRGDDPDADQRYPLQPEPTDPYYSATTAVFLANAGHVVTVTEDQRPRTQRDTAHSDPAADRIPRTPPTRRAPVTSNTPPTRARASPGSADPEHPGSGSAGTGRVGTGSSTSSTAGVPRPPRSRRSRRGATTR